MSNVQINKTIVGAAHISGQRRPWCDNLKLPPPFPPFPAAKDGHSKPNSGSGSGDVHMTGKLMVSLHSTYSQAPSATILAGKMSLSPDDMGVNVWELSF